MQTEYFNNGPLDELKTVTSLYCTNKYIHINGVPAIAMLSNATESLNIDKGCMTLVDPKCMTRTDIMQFIDMFLQYSFGLFTTQLQCRYHFIRIVHRNHRILGEPYCSLVRVFMRDLEDYINRRIVSMKKRMHMCRYFTDLCIKFF
jgi:hypothetical protein